MHEPFGIPRRAFLRQNSLGIGSTALAWLLNNKSSEAKTKLLPKTKQSFDLKAKAAAKPREGEGHDFTFSTWRALPYGPD